MLSLAIVKSRGPLPAGGSLGVGQAQPKTAEPANSSGLDRSTFAGRVNVGMKELEWWPNNWGGEVRSVYKALKIVAYRCRMRF
jgi:hypothetical protein